MRIFLTLMGLLTMGSVNAATIGQYSFTGAGGDRSNSSNLYFGIDYFPPTFPTDSVVPSLEIVFTLADVGTTIVVNNDGSIDDLVAFMTDGINESFDIRFGVGSLGGGNMPTEMSAFGTAPDFAGFNITGVGLVINSVTLDSPGSDPNGDGIWTDLTHDLVFEVYGNVVPIPAAALLFPSALVFLGLMRRRTG